MTKNWLSDKEYSFIFSRVPRLTVDLVIKNRQGIVLSLRRIQPYRGLWHLPGGRLFFREKLFDTARRVALEETGLRVKPVQILGAVECLHEIQNKERRHSVSVVVLARPERGSLKPDSQASMIRCFTKLPSKVHPPHKEFLTRHFRKKSLA